MRMLGLAGGFDDRRDEEPTEVSLLDGYWHDAAAAVLVDGVVVAAQEEERSRRLKHTSRFPRQSVQLVLAAAGLRIEEVDRIAVNFDEEHWARFVTNRRLHDPDDLVASPRDVIAQRLQETTGSTIDAERIVFVRHHEAHAWATFGQSGFGRALVLTLDGAGDREAGLLAVGDGPDLTVVGSIPIAHSIGAMYLWVTRYLGFRQFDEYKVMGLSAYGDPEVLRDRLAIFELVSDGSHRIDWGFADRLLEQAPPRRSDEPVLPWHADVAAAAQEALEEVVLHILRRARRATRLTRLCLGGGVAHNCALAGRIARTEQFREVFVHPASHDGGCAVGAALAADPDPRRAPRSRIRTTAWGRDVEDDVHQLRAGVWDELLEAVRPSDDLEEWAATRLCAGELLPWVDGRAELGPRALGQRSLLADPRRYAARQLINQVVKRREEFRPFAPVVRAERAEEYFEVPHGIDTSFMSFALPVRSEWVDRLKAVTHVDGTARVQTVTVEQHPRWCRLLDHFEAQTGVGVLLNTSLNVAGEPIVNDLTDVLAFLLTTGVRQAVVGEMVIRPRPGAERRLALVLPDDVRLARYQHDGRQRYRVERSGPRRVTRSVSEATFEILLRLDGRTPLGVACAGARAVESELLTLWRDRVIELRHPQGRR